MKRHLYIHDIDKISAERINTDFPALRNGVQCIKAKLNSYTFEAIKIVLGVLINFPWFLMLQGEKDRTPQFVYTAKYF